MPIWSFKLVIKTYVIIYFMEQQDEIEKELMATIAIQENKIQLLEKENSELRVRK